ncbi:MAG: alpha/beta fold hydrolase [Isosphaeraceae bacterium]
MNESRLEDLTFEASDGYAFHVALWPAGPTPRGHVVVLHGVQSHSGWYHSLGRTLADAGHEASFPDRRGSGPNARDRGHAPSGGRLVRDLAEWLRSRRALHPELPLTLAGISWGGKLAVILAARHPELVDGLALICPGLTPRVGVSFAEKVQIALAAFTNRRRTFPIPLSDPALHTTLRIQAFIAADPPAPPRGDRGSHGRQFLHRSRRATCTPNGPTAALLMLAGRDRIVDNSRPWRLREAGDERPHGHRVPGGPPHARVRSGPETLCPISSSGSTSTSA